MNSIFSPIVERHSTWLSVNPIQGCPNDCQYCFLKQQYLTRINPHQLISYDCVIDEIKKNKYYSASVPICLFSKTDALSCKTTKEYLKKLIHTIINSDLYNTFVIVTKCFIPEDIISDLVMLQNSGRQIVVYLSYSGLNNEVERGINKTAILNNFKNLFDNNIKIIHYFRPLIPQNTTETVMDDIISYVSKYAVASVVTGLKVYKALQSTYAFWPEITKLEKAYEYECIWPSNVKTKLNKFALKYNYPIYQTNSCALEYALNGYDRYGICGTEACENFNMCEEKMRIRCNSVSRDCNIINIDSLLNKIVGKNVKYKIEKNVLQVFDYELTNEDICFITYNSGLKVLNKNSIGNERIEYWNNSFNGSKQLFL